MSAASKGLGQGIHLEVGGGRLARINKWQKVVTLFRVSRGNLSLWPCKLDSGSTPQLLHCHGSKSGGTWRCQCQNMPRPDLGMLSEGGGTWVSLCLLCGANFLYLISLLEKVTADQNLGHWLNTEYKDRDKFKGVLDRVVLGQSAHDAPQLPIVSIEPISSVNDMMVGIHQLDYSSEAKHGCYLSDFNSHATCGKLDLFYHVILLNVIDHWASKIFPIWQRCMCTSRASCSTTSTPFVNRLRWDLSARVTDQSAMLMDSQRAWSLKP